MNRPLKYKSIRNAVGSFALIIGAFFLACCGGDDSSVDNEAFDDHHKEKLETIPLPEHGFYCAYLDSRGHVWIGSRGDGVFRFDGEHFKHYTTADGFYDEDISCITETEDGVMLFGTAHGICTYDGHDFGHIDVPKADTTGKYDNNHFPELNPTQVMSICEDHHGTLWIGTNGGGVYRYDHGDFEQFLLERGQLFEDGQQHNVVLAIAESPFGAIWFSSYTGGGISKWNGKNFIHFDKQLSGNRVEVMHIRDDGKIWIGSAAHGHGSLDFFDGQKFRHYHQQDDRLEDHGVAWIHEDEEGTLWLGSDDGGLLTFKDGHFKEFTQSDGSSYKNVHFVIGDANDNIWFGGIDGLWMYDGKEVQSLGIKQGVQAKLETMETHEIRSLAFKCEE